MTRPEDIFHELGDPTRLSVFRSILDRRLNVSQIVAELGLTQPQVSYHLKRLREAGLAVEQKDGRWVWYRANRESADGSVRALLDLMSGWLGTPPEPETELQRPKPAAKGEERPRKDEGRPVVKRPDKEDKLEDFLL